MIGAVCEPTSARAALAQSESATSKTMWGTLADRVFIDIRVRARLPRSRRARCAPVRDGAAVRNRTDGSAAAADDASDATTVPADLELDDDVDDPEESPVDCLGAHATGTELRDDSEARDGVFVPTEDRPHADDVAADTRGEHGKHASEVVRADVVDHEAIAAQTTRAVEHVHD